MATFCQQLGISRHAHSKRLARASCTNCRSDMRVVAIPGAIRKASTNNGLLRAAAQVLPNGMHMVQADISQLPLYNDDLWESGIPDSVRQFREQIDAADALLFSVPEYNFSLPGPMKNAIDWASKNPNVFAGKPATMLGEYADIVLVDKMLLHRVSDGTYLHANAASHLYTTEATRDWIHGMLHCHICLPAGDSRARRGGLMHHACHMVY